MRDVDLAVALWRHDQDPKKSTVEVLRTARLLVEEIQEHDLDFKADVARAIEL